MVVHQCTDGVNHSRGCGEGDCECNALSVPPPLLECEGWSAPPTNDGNHPARFTCRDAFIEVRIVQIYTTKETRKEIIINNNKEDF